MSASAAVPTRTSGAGDIRHIAVLGAGPIGLEAAAAATAAGSFEVTVIERGEVAHNVADWGHTRCFTPFGMNTGPAGRALLEGDGHALPEDDDLLTGDAFRAAYLLPLSERLTGRARLLTGTAVRAVTRASLLKGEHIGAAERAADPFRLLVEREGREEVLEADVVLDCTGTYGNPNWVGPGGGPALGERALGERIARTIPDLTGADRHLYAGRRTLLVGSGHSAATAALELAALAREDDASFVWATRRPASRPLEPITDDPLPERARLTRRANRLATDPPAGGAWRSGTSVVEIAAGPAGEGRSDDARKGGDGDATGNGGSGGHSAELPPFHVTLRSAEGLREEQFDRIIALVGYEPDDSIYRQLQIHECYASRGPMKLSAALLAAAGDGPVDCMETGGLGADVLRNPEPNYFLLGMKSYGKNSAFLLRTGYEQVRGVLGLLAAR